MSQALYNLVEVIEDWVVILVSLLFQGAKSLLVLPKSFTLHQTRSQLMIELWLEIPPFPPGASQPLQLYLVAREFQKFQVFFH